MSNLKRDGYVKGLPEQAYHHGGDEISSSRLKLMARSLSHYLTYESTPATPAMRFGSAVHSFFLTPKVAASQYLLLESVDDRRTKAYKDAVAGRDESFVLTSSDTQRLRGVVRNLSAHPTARKLFSGGESELSGFSTDPETGLRCRHRFDYLRSDGVGVDLKTTQDASEDGFGRSVATYGYDIQAAFYSMQHEWITGKPLKTFVFVAVESVAPYEVKCHVLDDAYLEDAKLTVRKWLNRIKEGSSPDIWPGYDLGVNVLTQPKWRRRNDADE